MSLKFPKASWHLFALLLLLIANASSAQTNYHNIIFRIDSLVDIGLPKSALSEVNKLELLARKENNTPQIIRSTLYRLNLRTYLEDDALVNVINSLKADIDKSGYPVKPILQSFLADMYWSYYKDNRGRFANRSRLEKPDVDFRNWDLATLTNETTRLYSLSLQPAEQEQQTPVGVLEGILTGDKNYRYLRPTLYDLLLHRAFDYFLADEAAITSPKEPFTLNDARFFADRKTFTLITVNTADTNSTWYRGIKFLQQGIAFRLKKSDGKATADLDLLRLKFVYDNSSLSNKDTLYIAALKIIAADTSAGNFRADALFTIGSQYKYAENYGLAIDYLRQAIAGYPKSPGAINSYNLLNQISRKSLSATIEDANTPDKPILSLLTYSNLKAIRYRVYPVTPAQVTLMENMDGYEGNIEPGKKTLAYLKKLKPVQDKQLTLPVDSDYREHTTELKIDALPRGTYVLQLQQGIAKDSLMQLQSFSVSRLAYLTRTLPNGNQEFRVTDRETGQWIKGAAITSVYDKGYHSNVQKRSVIKSAVTDENGAATLSLAGSYINMSISYKGDKIKISDQDIYTKINTVDKFQPILTTLLFTDRQIYRPGQTIYFKALQVRTVNGKGSIVPNAALTVVVKDRNSRELANVKLQTNEFGSAASSFVIPQNIINGVVSLSTDNGLTGVSVAEYKRPTFSVAFEPFTKNVKLNDTITVKGTVNAFSGYGLSAARVAYRVNRTRGTRFTEQYARAYAAGGQNSELATDTIVTDAQGKFEFKFLAKADLTNDADASNTFYINADVSDANGETQSAATSMVLSKNPVELELNIPDMLMPNTAADAHIMLFNASRQRQSGKATVEIYELKSPGEFFNNRLWDAPDKWLMSREEYHQNFPGFAYKGEDDYKNWKRLQKISNLEISLNKADAGALDINKLLNSPMGVYAIVVSAKSETGDTVSIIKYIQNIKEQAPLQKSDNWVLPISTTVKAGQPAEFFVGINKNCEVLMETYDEEKLLSSRRVALTAGLPQKISIPVPQTNRNSFSVQFAMINDNRLYTNYQRIMVADTVKPLNIRFLTMRNKVQPGEKEQWKLEITGSDDRQAAELLAGMYDASLDDITPPVSWQFPDFSSPYITRYFEWMNYPPSREASTNKYDGDNDGLDYDYTNTEISYEEIDMLGFNYAGDDNATYRNFQDEAESIKVNSISDKKIAAKYNRNAALVNNGYDVVGKVMSGNYNLNGIKVRIQNTNISTVTNSRGYFRIKVPKKSILIFSAKAWVIKKVNPQKGLKLIVQMMSLAQAERQPSTLREVMSAAPGEKDKRGYEDNRIRIDEPVGSSDVKMVVAQDAAAYYAPPAQAKLTRFKAVKPVAMMYDELYDDKLRKEVVALKEIRTNPKPITVRKNFSETAFFYPQLRTDEKGRVTIGFTIPEALTKWKFRGLAYNKKMQTGYIEQTVITQKQLMISANMPRFLREGDTMVVSARMVNLSTISLKGEAKLELFDALTMKPISIFTKDDNGTQRFGMDSAATKAVSFKLIIPSGLEALTYRLTASAGDFTDGEENTLPVLSNRMLVTETMPMMVRAGQTKTFSFEKLLNQSSNTIQSKTFTLEYTQNPAWLAVQALPYMMEFPYECSEQVFTRLYANSFASYIVNSNPKIKQVLDRWKATNSKELLSNLEKNQELKSLLLEETPWLQDAANETEQKKRIALLFDLNKTSYELGQNLVKLEKKQLPNGGFPWFGGKYDDRYITQHIIAGIGQLNKTGIAGDNAPRLNAISTKALEYLDKQLVNDEAQRKKYDKKYQSRNLNDIELHAWYARSYFKDAKPEGDLKEVQKNYRARAATQWTSRSEYDKAMIALTLYRTGDKETAAAIIKSLTETARQSDELGMYWAANTYGYYWYESPIETQSLMIELFTEAANNPTAVSEMKIWLLRNKQTNNWRTTKATAAACYALLLKGSDVLSATANANIRLDGKPLVELKPEIKPEAGTGYLKTTWVEEQIKPALGKVEIANTGKTINWGAMYWQYTERMDKITPSNTNVQMERKYFIKKQADGGPVLVAVDATHLPKTGDVLKVVIHLKADRDFDYIQLKDLRPASTEPTSTLAEYKYQDGLYYYQENRDVATNFFFSRLSKGTYVFEYELRVVQPGNYATGITSMQSMYAPEFNAHSDGGRITFK